MLTMNMIPPNCTNWLIWSTSLVTRETSEPRRSDCWCSIERSWMCRNARVRRLASAVSLVRNSRTFITYAEKAVSATAPAESDTSRPTRPRSGPPGARQAVVDDLLDRERHDHPPGGGDQREEEREPDAVAELGGELESAHEGVPGARGGRRGGLTRCGGQLRVRLVARRAGGLLAGRAVLVPSGRGGGGGGHAVTSSANRSFSASSSASSASRSRSRSRSASSYAVTRLA